MTQTRTVPVMFHEEPEIVLPVTQFDPNLVELLVQNMTAREEQWRGHYHRALSDGRSVVEATRYANEQSLEACA